MIEITEKEILLDFEATTAEECIRKAGGLLVQGGLAEERYVDAMVKGFRDIGPYMVLAPSIAIPHARPEYGALKQGLSIVRLKHPVVFGHPENDPVRLVCAICGVDVATHLSMLSTLANILRDERIVSMIMESSDVKEILETLLNYAEETV